MEKQVSATTTAIAAPTTPKYGHLFFEGLWRMSGIQAVAFLVIGSVVAGFGPGVGASPESLTAYYAGNSTRILIATPILGLGILNLLWFAAAIRTALADAGLDGWGAAATAASTAFGAIEFLLIAVQAGLAYTIAGKMIREYAPSGAQKPSGSQVVLANTPAKTAPTATTKTRLEMIPARHRPNEPAMISIARGNEVRTKAAQMTSFRPEVRASLPDPAMV